MNIFGYFPLFQSFTFCKSTSDIKKIQNKMAATQVALLLLSSILLWSDFYFKHFTSADLKIGP